MSSRVVKIKPFAIEIAFNSHNKENLLFYLNKAQIEIIEIGSIADGIKENKGFSAPIACLHYEYYSSEIELEEHLNENRESIQCIISNMPIKRKIDFGNYYLKFSKLN